MTLTFDEARRRHLARLDDLWAKLRAIVADPQWTNLNYKPYVETFDEVERHVRRIRDINESQMEADRCPTPPPRSPKSP